MKWISTKIKFPKEGTKVLAACKNKNMEVAFGYMTYATTTQTQDGKVE